MTDDLLARMTRALAEEKEGAVVAPRATRERVIESLLARRKKRHLRLVWGLPALAVFVGSSAWASYGGALPEWTGRVAQVFAFAKSSPERTTGSSARRSPARPVPAASVGAKPAATPAAAGAPLAAAPLAAAPLAAERAHVAPGAGAPLVRAEAVESSKRAKMEGGSLDALGVYREAHHAQFRSLDYAAAFASYARYLRLDPGGTFAQDARYNSALCALQLGRTDEAIRALLPFARGIPGQYRRAEARALLTALRGIQFDDQ